MCSRAARGAALLRQLVLSQRTAGSQATPVDGARVVAGTNGCAPRGWLCLLVSYRPLAQRKQGPLAESSSNRWDAMPTASPDAAGGWTLRLHEPQRHCHR